MSKLVVDTIQRPGGASMVFPTADGTTGQFLRVSDHDGSLYFGGAYTFPLTGGPLIAQEGKGQVGSISSTTYRTNIYSTGEWSSTGPSGSAYTNYAANSDPNLIQFINMALGDGKPQGTTEYFIGDNDREISRQLMFSNGSRLGYKRDEYIRDNSSDYGGHTMRIMPLRNTTNAAVSVSFQAYCTDYYSSGYEGTCMFVLAPNTSTYSTVTTVSSTRLSYSQTTTNTNGSQLTGSYSIPANTTVLVCLSSTHAYQTTYRFKDTNYWYGLDSSSTFSNSGIICDMRMLTSLYTSNFNLPNSGSCEGTSVLAPLWTKTATNFGDR